MAVTPTLLLVHGAWYASSFWDGMRARLGEQGFPTATVALPSCGADPTCQLGDLYDDIAAVRRAIQALEGPVVVCAHSYGGVPVTDGAADMPQVRAVLYVCAFILTEGQSLVSHLGGRPEWWVASEDERVLRPDDFAAAFLNECDPDTAAYAQATPRYFSVPATTQPIHHAVWRHVPTAYIATTQDTHLPLAAQQDMAARLSTTYVLESDHSPFLSHPEQLTNVLVTALGELGVRSVRGEADAVS